MYLTWRIWLIYLVLFIVAVPWYWWMLPVSGMSVWLGMPLWVVVSLAVSAIVSTFTAALLCRRWPDEQDAERQETHP